MKNNAYKRPDLKNPQQTINENFKQAFSMETTSMMLWLTLPKEDYKKSLKIPKG